jgi:hypothetical protein
MDARSWLMGKFSIGTSMDNPEKKDAVHIRNVSRSGDPLDEGAETTEELRATWTQESNPLYMSGSRYSRDLRETYKGLTCDSSSQRDKLGELEPSHLKTLIGVWGSKLQWSVRFRGPTVSLGRQFHCKWSNEMFSWRACCSYSWDRNYNGIDVVFGVN